jgi:hypothetical protein
LGCRRGSTRRRLGPAALRLLRLLRLVGRLDIGVGIYTCRREEQRVRGNRRIHRRGTTAAACAAQVASDWVNSPGIDPDDPKATPAQLNAWAKPLEARITTVRAGVPAGLTGQVDTLARVVRDAEAGRAPDVG